ncbi:MAG: ATP-binding protein [Bacteroidaceae bacterium]|nr:ATP-binding protein [Bacteroidaceae bacterium]
MLKGFYGALKSMDGCIRFVMLTGVTKLGKVSVFSDLNNLHDISMSRQYYDICGITQEELESEFDTEINALAAALGLTWKECLNVMRRRYDGYHFEESSPGMFNPFSVLNTFAELKFGSYWFETGTPTYLVQLLQKYDYNLEEMSRVECDSDTLNSIDSESSNPIPIIYQSGYLTICDYDPQFRTYTLGFPNEEVGEGFTKFLMPFYTCPKDRIQPFNIANFVRDVESGETERFLTRLRSLFSDTPYELIQNLENHYRNVVWLLFKLMDFYTQAEYHTSQGRIDLVVCTPKYCYVTEFKLDGTAEEAIAQIQDRNYALPFAIDDRQVVRIGINFDRATRNIDKTLVASD